MARPQTPSYIVYQAKKDIEGKRVQVAESYKETPVFRLPTGDYYVWVGHGQASASVEVKVTAGELTEQTLNLHAGYLQLSSIAAQDTEPVTRDLHYIVYQARKDRDGKRVQVAESYKETPLFRLPTGDYYVWVEHRGASGSAEVEIAAGQRKKITLEIKVP